MKIKQLTVILLILCGSMTYGQNWQLMNSGTSNNLFAVAFGDEQHGVIVGSNGTIKTTNDGGQSWVQATGIPSVNYKGACIKTDTSISQYLSLGRVGQFSFGIETQGYGNLKHPEHRIT